MAKDQTMDLDRDVTINGHLFAAGKGVSTVVQEPDPEDENGGTMDVDYGDAIRDVVKANKDAVEFASVHHGEVKDDGKTTTSSTVSGQSSNGGNSGGAPSGRGGNS